MNNFLATGGDGFTVFRQGTDQLGGEIDLDAFARYLEDAQPDLAAAAEPDQPARP